MPRRKTTDDFILEAKERHVNQYDYSLVNYVNTYTEVKIVCKKHGAFFQKPKGHLKGKGGCESCYVDNTFEKNKNKFLEKCNKAHNNKYDYSLVDYKTIQDRVIIICPNHGEFEQLAVNHSLGFGCARCSGCFKLTKEQFIERAKAAHEDNYGYEEVEYKNSTTKVKIYCKAHKGYFNQAPDSHMNGSRCGVCFEKIPRTLEEILLEFKDTHGDTYDYKNVQYKRGHSPVTIRCREHGDFKQSPKMHKGGQGCPLCGIIKTGESNSSNTQEFIEKANVVHEGRYNYENVNYINCKEKVNIVCSIHGDFRQPPQSHLRGSGCPTCADEVRGYSRSDYVKQANGRQSSLYFIKCFNKNEEFYKI